MDQSEPLVDTLPEADAPSGPSPVFSVNCELPEKPLLVEPLNVADALPEADQSAEGEHEALSE